MHRMLAIDPGVTTGYCRATLEDRLILVPGEAEFNMLDFHDWLDDFIREGPADDKVHVIYEDFTYRNYARMGLDLTPVKVIGIIELMQWRYDPLVTFTKQSAATGKAFYNDDRLKELGVYAVGLKHGRDATRHLLQWLNFGAGGQYCDVDKIAMEMIR